jgi:hypothetical protein
MKKSIGVLVGLLALVLFALSFFLEQVFLFLLGIPVLLLGIFIIIFAMVFELYQKDKKIDYELVKKHGLTLVSCKECQKENVLEDVYCIHCGERLDDNEI